MSYVYRLTWPASPEILSVSVTGNFDGWSRSELGKLHKNALSEMYETFVKVSEKQKLVFKFVLNDESWQVSESFKAEFDEHGNRNNYVEASELVPWEGSAEPIQDESSAEIQDDISAEVQENTSVPSESKEEPINGSGSNHQIGNVTSVEPPNNSDPVDKSSIDTINETSGPDESVEPVEKSVDTVDDSADTVEKSGDTVETLADPVEESVDAVDDSADTVETSADTVDESVSKVAEKVTGSEDGESVLRCDREMLIISKPILGGNGTVDSWHEAGDVYDSNDDKENLHYLSPAESSFTELSFMTSETNLHSAHPESHPGSGRKSAEDSFNSTVDETQSSVNTTGVLGIIEGTEGANDRLGKLTKPSEPRASSGFFGRLSSFFRS